MNLEADAVSQLTKIKNIASIKDSIGKMETIKSYIEATKVQDRCYRSCYKSAEKY